MPPPLVEVARSAQCDLCRQIWQLRLYVARERAP